MKPLPVQSRSTLEPRYPSSGFMRNMLWEADWDSEQGYFLQSQFAEKLPCLLRENCRGYELFPLGSQQYLVGRSPECDIWIHDPFISLCHATLIQVPGPESSFPTQHSTQYSTQHSTQHSSLVATYRDHWQPSSLQARSCQGYEIFDGYLETTDAGERLQFSSRNGLRVNGVPVQSKRLEDGDRIELGDMVLTYHLRLLDDDGLLF